LKTKFDREKIALLSIVGEGFLSRLSFGLVSFALPLYALHLGMSLPEIAFLDSLNVIVALALKPVAGWAADRFGLKPAFTIAVGLRTLVALLLVFVGAPWQLYAIRMVHGISDSLRDPSVNTLIAEHGGKKAIASTFAWYQTAKSLAGAVGKAVAGIVLTLTLGHFSVVFIIAAVLSALPLYTVARYVQEGDRPGKAAKKTDKKKSEPAAPPAEEVQPPSDKKLWMTILQFAGLGLMISSTASMLSGLLPILMTQYAGLSEAEAGIVYAISSVVTLLSGPMFGWLADNFSRKFVLSIRSIANIFSSVIYIAGANFWGVSLGKAVDDMGKAAFRPAWGTMLAQVSSLDKRRKARIITYMDMGDDIGSVAAPILTSLIWNAYGLTVVMLVRIVLAIATEIYALVLAEPRGKHAGAHKEKPVVSNDEKTIVTRDPLANTSNGAEQRKIPEDSKSEVGQLKRHHHGGRLDKGLIIWNEWKAGRTQIREGLGEAQLAGRNLSKMDLRNTVLIGAKLAGSNLSGADLRGTFLLWADLSHANLRGAKMDKDTILIGANLSHADLRNADMRKVRLSDADLSRANLTNACLVEADLRGASLDKAKLHGADLSQSRVFGVSAWHVDLGDTIQTQLVISKDGEPTITVDDLEVAQFIYLLLNESNMRGVIGIVTAKIVLIFGRFTPERKPLLDRIRTKLRDRHYCPVMFDFSRPPNQDFIKTFSTLANLARFVVTDYTGANKALEEAHHIIQSVDVPVAPILLQGHHEPMTLEALRQDHPSILDTVWYSDQEELLQTLEGRVIRPAETKHLEIVERDSLLLDEF
jgi:uncharacterized protein YjbI with pentapeptide repeats/MFS family permease